MLGKRKTASNRNTLRRRLLCAALVIPGDRTPAQGLLFRVPRRDPGATATDRRPAAQQPQGIAGGNGSATAERGSGPAPNRGAGSPLLPGLRNAGISRCFRRQGKTWGWPRPTAGEGRRPPPARRTPRPLTLERMLELQADTIEALVRAAGPATPYMPWASGTGGPPCFGSVAGVKPGRAPGVPAPSGSWPNQWPPSGLRRKAAAWLDPPPR